MLSPEDQEEIARVGHALADAAREPILDVFRRADLGLSNKDASGGFDPVTLADRSAEQAMRRVLETVRPNDGIIGEEFGQKAGTSGIDWVLDPIDGTRAFMCGATSWGVLISAERDGVPIFGIIDQPYLDERFVGRPSGGVLTSRSGSTPLKTRGTCRIEDAILLSTFPEVGSERERGAFERVRDRAKLTRYGLDCYGYALVALGQCDLVIEAGLNRYDISAPIAVVEAAGGIVTDWRGNVVLDGGQVIAAANVDLHRAALSLLNS